jgi:hypothetical protein
MLKDIKHCCNFVSHVLVLMGVCNITDDTFTHFIEALLSVFFLRFDKLYSFINHSFFQYFRFSFSHVRYN